MDHDQNARIPEPRASTGCGGWLLFVLVLVGLVAAATVAEFLFWLRDELTFEAPHLPVGIGRAVILPVFALIVIVPLASLSIRRVSPLYRAVFRTWLAGAASALLFTPVRLFAITDSQAAQAVQALILVLVLIGMRIAWRKQNDAPQVGSWTGLVIALAVGGLIAWPWLAWGALGSPVDTLLGAIVGGLLGWVAALALEHWLLRAWRTAGISPGDHFGMAVLTMVVFLGLLVIGVGYTGFSWYLLLVVPILGWSAAGLAGGGAGWRSVAVLFGMGAAFPMMLVDPDELSIVISAGVGTGEILDWVLRAGAASLLIGIVAGFVLQRIYHRLPGWGSKRPGWAIAGVIWAAAALIYFIPGQPGFFGERLFVLLKPQADLSTAPGMTDYNQRRQFVYQALVSQADASQKRLRDTLGRFGIQTRGYYLENAIQVNAGPLVRAWLEAQPEVDRVLDNPELRPLPAPVPVARGTLPAPQKPMWNQTLIGADRVWNELGVTGHGIVVGQSDSGADGGHPELAASYRGQGKQDENNWFDPWNHSPHPVDVGGHGTHTLGSILGQTTGIAPGATWIGCVNLARNLGNPSYYLDCMQFMLAPFPQGGDPLRDGDPTRSANVLNNSWGCPAVEGCDAGALKAAVDALRAAGIFVVASTGNEGMAGCGSVADPPAIYDSSYSVGAVDKNGQLADFSSLGPVVVDGSNRIKPDIAAPGEDVVSAFPGGTYESASGTSMAGPHVVGVVALMWSANPALVGNIEATERILDDTARKYTGKLPACALPGQDPNDGAGWGLVDAFSAVKAAQQAK